jgi:ectoine hydroxylase-related dioxygenase (phytanoyl-CoA dioxygenase family)
MASAAAVAAATAAAATITAAEVAQFHSTGVVIKRGFFSAEEAAAMRATVQRFLRDGLMADIQRDDAQNLQMAWLSAHSHLFACLPWEPRVAAAAAALLAQPTQPGAEATRQGADSTNVEVHYDQLFYKPARVGAGTSWHTDNGYFRIADPLRGVGMWIALDDSSAANGTLELLPWCPGQPELPHRENDPDKAGGITCADELAAAQGTSCTVEAGGVVFFCYGVPHCTRDNPTETPRYAQNCLLHTASRRQSLALSVSLGRRAERESDSSSTVRSSSAFLTALVCCAGGRQVRGGLPLPRPRRGGRN